MKTTVLITSLLFLSLIGTAQTLPDNIDISTSATGVVPLPGTVNSSYINGGFVKYTKIECPNGEAIHFIAQSNITEAMIVRARTILEFYLTDVPGSQYGDDKSNVKNTMGTNDATLLLMNGSDDGTNDPTVNGQPLYEEEMAVEGHSWYQNNNYDHRDASFEEILHMMHDMGIGVDGPNSIPNPALPAFQLDIRAAQLNANANNFAIWPIGAGSDPGIQNWYNELDQENSLSQEYLASLIDSYYGLWDPWTDDPNTGMWGIYIAHNRDEIITEDTMGWSLLPKFFSPVINVDMIIDPGFNGIFSLTFNSAGDYTAKSRYLQHVYLTGSNTSGLQGNDLYNRLRGNSANNTFEGLKGNDRLDGQAGSNTAIFSGPEADYTVTNYTNYATVADGVNGRDGVDTLWNIQQLQFSDNTVPITLTPTLSIDESKDLNIKIYPNPSTDMVQIEFDQITEGMLDTYDANGKLVQSQKLSDQEILIDVSQLESGMYQLKLDGHFIGNFIKK